MADAPTPTEALKIAGLNWTVEQWPLSATNGECRIAIQNRVLNVRTDTKHPLGIVGKDWVPFQNHEMAEFCESLAEQNDTVKIESAGSIWGGEKVWFLMKGESFSVRHVDDEIVPYILASNGFDGGTRFRCTPTTIRVVCPNTLHMVIPSHEHRGKGFRKLTPRSFSCKHSGRLRERVEKAKIALQLYSHSLEVQRELIDTTAAKNVNRDDIKRFFLECYIRDFGVIADAPVTGGERRQREKAMLGFIAFAVRFDQESQKSGANAWTAFNAYAGFLQHDQGTRLKDLVRRDDQHKNSILFGTISQRTIAAFSAALNLSA